MTDDGERMAWYDRKERQWWKRCSCCRQAFPAWRFDPHPRSLDGLQSACMDCRIGVSKTAARLRRDGKA